MGPMRTQYILTVRSAGKRKCQDAEGNCLLLIGSEGGTSFLDQSQSARNGLLKHGSLHNVSFVDRKAFEREKCSYYYPMVSSS